MAEQQNQLASEELWETYFRGDAAARRALIECYLPLVKRVCGRLSINLPSFIDRGDLESAGVLGLIEALSNYRPEKGVRFETFAVARIRGAALDSLRKLDLIPRSVRQKARRLQQVLQELYEALGSYPSQEELAAALGLSLDELDHWWQDVKSITILSLNSPIDQEDGGEERLNLLSAPDHINPLNQLLEQEGLQELSSAIDELSTREKQLLSLYYDEGLTLKELGQVLGVTESRASQIHSSIIIKLRARLQLAEGGKASGKRQRGNRVEAGRTL